ncbi:MAG: protein adenylyltransferase SelO [Bdellovibrio bacteriovorus]
MTFVFDNSYARLPPRFYVRQAPASVAAPRLVRLNEALAADLGLDPTWLGSPEGVAVLAGNSVPEGAEPLAMAYAGHQFGGFVPQLGDGRAILLGEVLSPRGERFDIQLKGSGRTPFSRGGDGRAWLGPVLREYIIGEAMHALGIPTTRALAAVATGESVHREGALPGAVLTRVARGHVRVGTFEYFAARRDTEALRQLADYAIARHYPESAQHDRPYRAFLDAVIERQAALIAQWLGVGFIHGVMNTDNMSIAGETIDYGPCAFMDDYHPGTVYSSIDRGGRYAYGNQPRIAHWNLSRLAECLVPLLDEDPGKAVEEAQAAIDAFPARFEEAYLGRFRAKLGLATAHPDDGDLAADLLQAMAETGADFTNGCRALCDAAEGSEGGFLTELGDSRAATEWLQRWRLRLETEAAEPGARAARMRRSNPALIPRNHRVEAALAAALEDDLGPLDALLGVLACPWEDDPAGIPYRAPPNPHEVVHQTFCGT